MEITENILSTLPMNTLKDIPTPNPDAKTIVALVKESGRITGYKLSDGTVLSKEEGVRLAKSGGIRGVGVGIRKGTEYLKSLPDGAENNNLGNLPSVSNWRKNSIQRCCFFLRSQSLFYQASGQAVLNVVNYIGQNVR